MDSIAFTQERMKRQMDDLQDKIAGAPTDIGDLRDRVEDIERGMSKGGGAGGVSEASSEDLKAIRKDLDKILGRDEMGTAEVEGIPTLVTFLRMFFLIDFKSILSYRPGFKLILTSSIPM